VKPPVRYMPVTRNGRTHHIPTPGPTPPRDWDHIVLTAVTAATAILVTVSVAWSTASIGDLLQCATAPTLAYGAAAAFDLTWIIAMAVEWLARYDTDRARLPRRAGHVALLAAVAAVGVHGWLAGDWSTAVVGGAISALAKGGWTLVMHHQAVTLDQDTAAWLHAERAARGAARALAAGERTDARAAGQLAAIRDSLAPSGPDMSGTVPDTDVQAAVRDAPDAMPGADPQAIAAYLSRAGLRVTPDTPGQDDPDTDTAGHPANVRDIRSDKSGGIAGTVRSALTSGVRDRDTIVATVRATHGPQVPRDTVIKTLRRLDPTA
jgi:hypothetical protein